MQNAILLSVTDNELFIGELFGVLLAAAGVFVSLTFFFRIINARISKEKLEIIPYLVVGFLIISMGIYIYDIDHELRTESIYVTGVTIGFCRMGENGRGIEFVYYVNGIRYTNCNGYRKNVLVPGGKYLVRVSTKHPDVGHIDYEKRVE
jgi:hypothetical protein